MCVCVCVTDTSGVVFEEGPGDGGRKQWSNEQGQPLVAILQEKTLQTATYAVNKDELSKSLKLSWFWRNFH